MRARAKLGAWVAATLAAAMIATGVSAQLSAQKQVPLPRPMGKAEFPAFVERTLSNGAKLIVATQNEVPFVNVDLVVRGGNTADLSDKIGTAALVAELLTKGTPTRTADDIARETEFLGGTLQAAAFSDWTTVYLGVLQPDLPAGLALMADVVMNPTFPDDQVAQARARAQSDLETSLGQPFFLAGQAFTRAIYGDHAYGRVRTPEALQTIDRIALQTYHRLWFHPSAALFVVSGPLTADQATTAIEHAFGAWSQSAVPALTYKPAPATERTRVVLVHQPGSAQASVRLGQLLPRGDYSNWPAFMAAEWVLAGTAGRVIRTLRDEKRLVVDASSSFQRRLDVGVWSEAFETSSESAADAITAALAEVERMRGEMVPAAEIDAAKAFVLGPVGRPVETTDQIAGQIFSNRAIGLPDDELRTYRDRFLALDASDLREASTAVFHPDRMVIAVVGDAILLADKLAKFGPIEVVDADGRPLDTTVLLAKPTAENFDASILRPGTFEYRVMLQGNEVGRMKRELVADTTGGRAMAFRGTISLGPQTIDQEVVFGVPGFDARSARMSMDMSGQKVSMDARIRDGRLSGTVSLPTGNQPVDREVPPGTLVADMVEMAVWIADLEVGKEIRVPVARLETGGVETQVMRVVAIEDLTVPAGTFKAYRVEIAGSEPQTVWARVDAPHVLLKLAPAGQPLTLELVALPPG